MPPFGQPFTCQTFSQTPGGNGPLHSLWRWNTVYVVSHTRTLYLDRKPLKFTTYPLLVLVSRLPLQNLQAEAAVIVRHIDLAMELRFVTIEREI